VGDSGAEIFERVGEDVDDALRRTLEDAADDESR
jgi:hypothetical protein